MDSVISDIISKVLNEIFAQAFVLLLDGVFAKTDDKSQGHLVSATVNNDFLLKRGLSPNITKPANKRKYCKSFFCGVPLPTAIQKR
jgi:hypothetical protein